MLEDVLICEDLYHELGSGNKVHKHKRVVRTMHPAAVNSNIIAFIANITVARYFDLL